ncbi:MAG: tRNA-dihydrouridine synthase, partial [Clostridiales bacterium]|nr:tRNA-dihydrouridine synthase [Clostridiales bacterium]
MLRETGCDGVAVGRGSIGNPWIFGDIASAIDTGTDPGCERTPGEILEAALALLRMSVAEKGEKRGVAESKYSLSHFVKGLRGASEARARIMSASSSAEIAEALTLLLSEQKGPE